MITLRNPILTNPAYKRVERQESHTYGEFLFLRIFVCKEKESCGRTEKMGRDISRLRGYFHMIIKDKMMIMGRTRKQR